MKSPTEILLFRNRIWQLHGIDILSIVLSIIIGFLLALLILKLGLLVLPIAVFLILILPWMVQDPFRLFIWLIVTWPVLTLYARIPLPPGIPDITYELVLVGLMLVIILLEGFVFDRRFLKATTLDILVLIFIAAQLSSRIYVLWYGGTGIPDLNGLLRVVFVMAMYWTTKNLIVSRWHLKWLLYAFILASVFICFSGLIEQVLDVQERLFTVSPEIGGSTNRWLDVPGGRAAGVLGNPAIYGAVLGTGVLASLACLVHSEHKLTQTALVATIVVLLYGVFASYTRSAWVSVIVTLFFAQFYIKQLWRRTLPIFFVSVLLLILIWSNLAENPLMESRVLDPRNVLGRFDLAQLAWDRFLERPLFGWGHGALNIFSVERFEHASHNTFLTYLVDGGLLVFLSFSAILLHLLVRAINVFRLTEKDSFERSALAVMTGSILIFLMTGLVIELRYFGYFNVLFWICVGVIDYLGVEYGNGGTSYLSK